MIFTLLTLIFLHAPLDAKAGETSSDIDRMTPECGPVGAQLTSILDTPMLHNAKVGVLVINVRTGDTLFEHGADDLLVPASNVKLLTTAAALDGLGPHYQFQTDILGKVDTKGVVREPIYLRGNGDPWLIPERLWYLASRLFYTGVKEIKSDLIVDESYFAGDKMAKGKEQDTSSFAYMAPRGAVSLGFNALLAHVRPGTSVDKLADVQIQPPSAYVDIDNQARTVQHSRTRLRVDVVAKEQKSVVQITGRINRRDRGRAFYRRVEHPGLYTGEVFKKMLKQMGIIYRSGKVKLGQTPDRAPPKLASLKSMHLSELVGRINKFSNNFMSEQVALALGAKRFGAPGTWDKAAQAINEFLRNKVGIDSDDYSIQNASGLHNVNRFSPRHFIKVLEYMYHQPLLAPEYRASMAVAGRSGTLGQRMKNSLAEGLLRAKTGTLSMASALSGYVTTYDKSPLAFSILINNYRSSITEVWALQNAIGIALSRLDLSCEKSPTPPALSALTPRIKSSL
jgi:serine-type D-Ala-D-Ala carboxypeptidase/endopeptidase (penicillin-binding protein 4)